VGAAREAISLPGAPKSSRESKVAYKRGYRTIARLGVPGFGGGTGCTCGFRSSFAKIALIGMSRGERGNPLGAALPKSHKAPPCCGLNSRVIVTRTSARCDQRRETPVSHRRSFDQCPKNLHWLKNRTKMNVSQKNSLSIAVTLVSSMSLMEETRPDQERTVQTRDVALLSLSSEPWVS
jgi:hypothetical protein